MLEKHFQQLIKHFPNLIDEKLREMPTSKTPGQVNVCLEFASLLPVCDGILDLAFVTTSTIYLVEMKKKDVNECTLKQYQCYESALRKYYPEHRIKGFLVGTECPNRNALEAMIGDQDVRVMLFGWDIPPPNDIVMCSHCMAGVSVHEDECPLCGKALV